MLWNVCLEMEFQSDCMEWKHQLKALILTRACNVGVRCHGKAHCMLTLKLQGEFSGEKRCF